MFLFDRESDRDFNDCCRCVSPILNGTNTVKINELGHVALNYDTKFDIFFGH